jgi:hypothetical protein
MTSQDDEDKENMRMMWIASGVIVLFILGMMGLSMLSDKGPGFTEMSSQSRSVFTSRGPIGTDCSSL